LPDNANYNFEGVLDEVKLWDTALVPTQVIALTTTHRSDYQAAMDLAIYPNPSATSIRVRIPEAFLGKPCRMRGYDLMGRMVLDHQWQQASVEESVSVATLSQGIYLLELGNTRIHYRTTLFKK